ncbi:MAG: hypothetical protein ACXVHM_00435 [Methanobacterium sp.]
MDIGDYYYKSIKGFEKNPNIAFPSLFGSVLIYAALFIGGLISFLVFTGPNLFNSSYVSPDTFNYSTITTVLIIALIIALFAVVVYSFIYASTIGMAKRIIKGERPEINVGLKYGKKYFIRVFLVNIILLILFILASLPFILGILLYTTFNLSFFFIIIGILITIFLYAIIEIIFIFTYQSVVTSKKSVLGSFKDSVHVFRKKPFEIFVVLIVNALIIGIISIFMLFFGLFFGLIPILGSILSAIVGIIINTLFLPYFTLVLTYLYMDIKEIPMQRD